MLSDRRRYKYRTESIPLNLPEETCKSAQVWVSSCLEEGLAPPGVECCLASVGSAGCCQPRGGRAGLAFESDGRCWEGLDLAIAPSFWEDLRHS